MVFACGVYCCRQGGDNYFFPLSDVHNALNNVDIGWNCIISVFAKQWKDSRKDWMLEQATGPKLWGKRQIRSWREEHSSGPFPSHLSVPKWWEGSELCFFFVFLSPSPLHPTFPKKSLRTWWVIRDCGAFLSWQLMEWNKWMISSSGTKDEVFLTVGLHFYLCSCSSSSVQGRIEGSFVLLIPWIWDHIYMQMYHLVHNWRENITAMSTWYISTVRPDAKSAKELKGFRGAFFIVSFL